MAQKNVVHPDFREPIKQSTVLRLIGIVAVIGLLVIGELYATAQSGWRPEKVQFYISWTGMLALALVGIYGGWRLLDDGATKCKQYLSQVYAENNTKKCQVHSCTILDEASQVSPFLPRHEFMPVKMNCFVVEVVVSADDLPRYSETFFSLKPLNFDCRDTTGQAFIDSRSGEISCIELDGFRLWRHPYLRSRNSKPALS